MSPVPVQSLALRVDFTFQAPWEVGPAGKLNTFPPGGGFAIHEVMIAPVDLANKTAAEILQIQVQRAGDIALVAQAIAAAETQFANALAALES